MNGLEPLLEHVIPAMLVIFRIGGLVLFGPLLVMAVVPIRVRVLLVFSMGLAAYPALSTGPLAGGMPDVQLWMLLPLVGMEITFGAVIGFLATLPLLSAQVGGLVMGQQMGLGFARFFNPGVDDESDVIGQLLFLFVLAVFLMMGGLEFMFAAVLHSFEYVPLGGFRPDISLLELTNGMLLAAFEFALRMSAPLLALIFLETVAMGFVAKTVPQLNILSLGFPIRILAGIFFIAVGLYVIREIMIINIDEGLSVIRLWVTSA